MKRKKLHEITDDMIGRADKVCRCSSVVGDIIIAKNEGRRKKTSLKKLKSALEKRFGEEK